jgi:hypothetical protein
MIAETHVGNPNINNDILSLTGPIPWPTKLLGGYNNPRGFESTLKLVHMWGDTGEILGTCKFPLFHCI